MATYTDLTDIDVPAIAAAYALNNLHLHPIPGGAANSSFKATATQGEFVLTILNNHDHASAQTLAAHTQTFFDLGIPTTEVIPNTGGDRVSSLAGRPVLLKRWIEGQVIEPLPDHLLPQVGSILAQLHSLPPDTAEVPAGTRRLSPQQLAKIPDFADRPFATWLADRLQRVLRREADLNSPQVISHGDLFADNIIVRPNNNLAIIDWETVCLDSALLDVGMAVLGTAQHGGRIPAERANLVVSGYNETRPLSSEELSMLPTAVEHAALIIAFHRYYRHNIRFPDQNKSQIHQEIVDLVETLDLTP